MCLNAKLVQRRTHSATKHALPVNRWSDRERQVDWHHMIAPI